MSFRFRYVWALKDAFLSSGIAGLQNLDNRGWIAGIDANAYVANHDTERVSTNECTEPALNIRLGG